MQKAWNCIDLRVTRVEKLTIWLHFNRFWLVTQIQIIRCLRNYIHSFQGQGRGSWFFFKVTHQISMSHQPKSWIWIRFGQDYKACHSYQIPQVCLVIEECLIGWWWHALNDVCSMWIVLYDVLLEAYPVKCGYSIIYWINMPCCACGYGRYWMKYTLYVAVDIQVFYKAGPTPCQHAVFLDCHKPGGNKTVGQWGMGHCLQLAGVPLLWLVGLNIDWDCLVPRCIMLSRDQWGFPPFFRPQWQSLCTSLTASIYLPLGLCKGTVKESTVFRKKEALSLKRG